MLPPLWILAIGIITVIGMIIVLRINAFIALITAAIVVSLLAPGDIGEKISRVADAFGRYAGAIGIVIALAAVIGKCMMDSGAADRVVRAFLDLLGEKRSSFALMSSGFVLAVPVFFDTVFYLLVPLARSLFRRTGRNYLMYILAIAAGGAITHTLVPPTPGPLIMAANLSVDLGTMMMVGGLVALPAALVGVLFAKAADNLMDVPMRQVGSEPEPEPLDDSELPSLTMSLLPVVLPVLMISSSTVLNTVANAERVAQLSVQDIQDWDRLGSRLSGPQSTVPGRHLARHLDEQALDIVSQDPAGVSDEQKQTVVAGLNRVLAEKTFFDHEAFQGVLLPEWRLQSQQALSEDQPESSERAMHRQRMQTIHNLLNQDRNRMKKAEVERLNRSLLEISFPESIRPHAWDTPRRQWARVSNLFGNANFALLVSTAVAVIVYYRQRRPSLVEMSKNIELSLMSGGAIILITAAGGAFGAMLSEAQIGPAIQDVFRGSQGAGMFYLFLGFLIAAVLKIAQGSSTTAMIVASGMLASSVASVELPYHAVYLATAIGAGSLVGSWMNDSGFWIFTKMGGLTELESLKSWTLLLIALAVTSFAVTLLLATVMPLV